jgi:hypothetical protein
MSCVSGVDVGGTKVAVMPALSGRRLKDKSCSISAQLP